MKRFTLLLFVITGLAAPAVAADRDLQDQMTRVIQLEALDAWCARAHDINYDALRKEIDDERTRTISLNRSEREMRIAYAAAQRIFLIKWSEPVFFCEHMYRAKDRPGFGLLKQIFKD